MNVTNEMNKPTETQEQEALLRWVSFAMCKWPELELIYHIPNEGKRSRANGASLKRQGLQKGVPDLCLPVARGGYHALYIEMKRKGGKPSKEQLRWIENLKKQGNFAVVCEGWEQAEKTITEYMKQKPCVWCSYISHNRKIVTDLNFMVIDDDFAQPVPESFIKFCPFCGRKLED